MHIVTLNDKELGKGTMTECFEFIAAELNGSVHTITMKQAMDAGFRISQ